MATYDPSQVIITVLGNLMSGLEEIEVEKEEETWTWHTSTDGQVVRIKNLNKQMKFRLVFSQASLSNQVLSAAAALDDLTNSALGPSSLTDLNGTSLVQASLSCVQKPANLRYSKEHENREWIIACGDGKMNVGGITSR